MKVAIIGAGNMGGAIATGLLDSGFVSANEMIVIDPVNRSFQERSVEVRTSIDDSVQQVDMVIVAVKPWIANEVMRELASVLELRKISVCSVVAGLTLDTMTELIIGNKPLFRVMPNTAVRVGEGMTFVCSRNASADEIEQVEAMFATMGSVMTIEEKQIDACMALASCGIAYALRYVRAAMEGGVELGVSASASQSIVAQTLRGAAALLADGSHPEVEIDKVTTPGGITIKGLNAMEENGFTNAVIQGLKASK